MPLPPGVPELRALDLLVSVAQLGSLGAAAREHGISQPAASTRIAELERRLGVPLLVRGPTGSRPTRSGALVVDWARAVLDAAAALGVGIAALRAERANRLRIAASLTVAEYLVPGWLVRGRDRFPDVAVSLRVANSALVAGMVLDRAVDLGFVEGPALPAGLRARTVRRDQLLVVVAPGHPWARRRRELSAAELGQTPLVQRESGSGTRETLDRMLRPAGPVADPLVELSSTTSIKAAVAGGAGPGVLSSLAVAEELAQGRLVAVPVAGVDLSRRLRAIWPAGSRPAGAAADFLVLAGRR